MTPRAILHSVIDTATALIVLVAAVLVFYPVYLAACGIKLAMHPRAASSLSGRIPAPRL